MKVELCLVFIWEFIISSDLPDYRVKSYNVYFLFIYAFIFENTIIRRFRSRSVQICTFANYLFSIILVDIMQK